MPGVAQRRLRLGRAVDRQQVDRRVEFPGQSATSVAERVTVPLRSITQNYFDVMGMSIVEGRPFRETDGPSAPRVAIVNETLARRYYAGP